MANKAVVKFVGKHFHNSGKCVNVYDTYAHALAHASTGLSTILALDKTTGGAGSAISQVAKTTGAPVDENGYVCFVVDNGANVFLKIEGAMTPIVVPTVEMF
jgi:hypothetical protein